MKNHSLGNSATLPMLGIAFALIVAAPIASAQEKGKAPTWREAAAPPQIVPPPSVTSPVAPAPGTVANAPALPTAAAKEPSNSAPVQDTAASKPVEEEEEQFEPAPQPLLIGDSARSLLAWQRDASIASPAPRPIAGDIAQRSYERYLKSFEFPIPERFNSTVKSGSGGR